MKEDFLSYYPVDNISNVPVGWYTYEMIMYYKKNMPDTFRV